MKRTFITLALLLAISICGMAQSQSAAMRKLSMTEYAIQNLYVDKLDENKLTEDVIEAMLKKLDPHSSYMNVEETKQMNEPLQGNFEGVGIQFNMLNDTLFVIQTIPGGPSEKVGIMAGDRIIMVNDTLVAGVKMKNTDIMKRLRGKKGSIAAVKVLRRGVNGLVEFRIVRDKIPIYSLDASYMVDKNTGYIKINKFAATTYDEFLKAMRDLKKKGMKNLILDLEDNGGGYLTAATNMADEFLKDDQLIVYTQGYHQSRDESIATKKGEFETGKLVVMIDENTASASEIVSGAIQDWDRGVIVGRRSFGKGLVQRPIPLPDGSMIRLTVARYYTPSGRCIQKSYEDGIDKYKKDLIDRYNKGELVHADSIHFPDSLKAFTKINRRIVYGGGGIMPDYFVPMDTARYTVFYINLVAKGILNKYCISYFDDHRNEFKEKYPTFEAFDKGFNVTDEMIDQLLAEAKKDKVVPNDTAYAKNKLRTEVELKATLTKNLGYTPSDEVVKYMLKDMQAKLNEKAESDEMIKTKPLLQNQIKALIARDLFDMTAYFRVINSDSDSFKKA
ncbi:MAG: S41 family peptidase, partial [Bacteroidota bacterium]|nr:S41 family peptidase [Bacteroidota bacterium]